MRDFEVRATFALPGAKAEARLILTPDCFQHAQIRLGDDWHTLSAEEGRPYIAMFEQLRTFGEHGVTRYMHMKKNGVAGRIATMTDGTQGRFWVDHVGNGGFTWRPVTPAESAEMDEYCRQIALLQPGDAIMWYESCATTGNHGWRTGTFQHPSVGKYRVQDAGPLNLSGAYQLASYVLPIALALNEDIPGAQGLAA